MNELLDYPFKSAVWGTAADWSLFFVTAVTLWYLIRTFRSQTKIIKLQASSNLVQNELYRSSHQPSFTFTVQKFSNLSDVETYFEVALTLNAHQANDVRTEVINHGGEVHSYKGTTKHFPIFHPNHVAVLRFTTKVQSQRKDPWASVLEISLLFSDPVGNEYEQGCVIEFNEHELEIKQPQNSRLQQ